MAGFAHHFLLDPLFAQPFLGAEGEDSHDKLFAPVAVAPSELDISPFGSAVILCLVKRRWGHERMPRCQKNYSERLSIPLRLRSGSDVG